MNVSEPFIRRPVMTTLVMGAILLFGAMAYRRLPVSDLPNVDFPTIQVQASLPGASPETMASSVAMPLEREFSTIDGVDTMTSSSQLGSTTITLQFVLSRDLDAAAQDVQAAISRAGGKLPRDMPSPPSYRKVNPADQPILFLALTSPTLPLYQLNEYGETLMAQRISMLSGVAQVEVRGAQKYAVRIRLDPRELANRGIGIDEVSRAIQGANVNLPTGGLWGEHRAYTIEANGQITNAAEYRPVIVTYRNGKPVRLGDIGTVIDSVENDKTAAWFGDQRGVILAIQRQPGSNTVEVARSIRELLPSFRSLLPASVNLHVVYDRSETIQESVRDVKFTLLFTLLLVVMVIFLFLRNLSATLIPSLAMPLSIAGTFAVMLYFDYSLDNLSLMALILSMGFVVDDAIVMLENIVRHMEQGEHRLLAAVMGSWEISFTIVSMTLSLAAVFIPVLFMGGIVGRLFHEFAVTIGVAVLVSGFVSLTLTPMMCSRFLMPPSQMRQGRFYRTSEGVFRSMLSAYERGLKWSLQHRFLVILTTLGIVGGTVYLFASMPKGFLPNEDTNRLFVWTEGAEGISFDAMSEKQQRLAQIVMDDPNVAEFVSSAGSRGGGFGVTNSGIIFMHLKPRGERPLSADEMVVELRAKMSRVTGIRAFPQVPPPINIGGRMSKSLYQLTLQSPNLDDLYRATPILEARMKEIPGLVDVTSDLQLRNPEVKVDINRDKASSLGVTAQAVEEALYTAYGFRQISTIYAPTNQYQVIMELDPRFRFTPNDLSYLYVRSSSGELVPLSTVADFHTDTGPLTVNHSGQIPSVTLSFNLKPDVSLGDAVAAVEKVARSVLPDSVTTNFQGTAQAFQSSVKGLGMLLVLAILVIYIVLGILYESFIHPVTILSALPLAGFGALVTLKLFHIDLNIYAFVGMIMLVGLVKKNGIIMIDFALEAQRTRAKKPEEAIYEACVVRFRPIMMTTMAALLGTLPIAFGFGAGGESRQPLGLAVVGGLLFSQILTLFITPVVYLYMDRLLAWLTRLGGRTQAQKGPGTGNPSSLGDLEGL